MIPIKQRTTFSFSMYQAKHTDKQMTADKIKEKINRILDNTVKEMKQDLQLILDDKFESSNLDNMYEELSEKLHDWIEVNVLSHEV